MARKKIREYEDVVIEKFEFPNNGVAYLDERKVKVKNAIPGQKLDLRVQRKRKGDRGAVINLKEKSPMEIEPKCKDFELCGGCTFQNISYEDELVLKEKMVLELFQKNNINIENKYMGINPSPNKEEYRNKMEYSFGDESKDGDLALGMRKRNSQYEVVTSKHCNIVNEDYRKILNYTLDFFKDSEDNFYHKMRRVGTLRHLLVRQGYFTNQIIVGLVTTSGVKSDLNKFKDGLLNLDLKSEIKGIYNIVNDGLADTVQADELKVLHGDTYFYDELLGLKFKINIFSFFQTNSAGAEELYKIVHDFIGDTKDKVIFDLYCGTGTISQIVSTHAKKVIGVEIVEEAVEDAKVNCQINNITNAEFIAGDVLKVIDEIKDKPDIIILDPPRNGINEKALHSIINYGVDNIIYVSCKPSSLVRDLKIFEDNGYKVEKVMLQDLFSRTYHVETICLLRKI